MPGSTHTSAAAYLRKDAIGVAIIAVIAFAMFRIFPDNLSFLAGMIATMLLVISLDLVTGIGGVATLGHSALFGAGAYAAGIAASNGVTEPVTLLLIGLAGGGIAGLFTGAIILRTHGLPQLVLSIALVQLAHELVNKASTITGGSDGLTGIFVDPLFGRFEFDLWGVTAYWLSVVILIGVVICARRLIYSPFGMLVRGLRQDRVRVSALGLAAYPAALKMYVISGTIAGLGGAMMALSTQVVGLDSISFTLSAESLVMLIVGGTGSIFGAVAGTFVYMWLEHMISAANPFHWLAIMGALLVAVVLFAPRGLYGSVSEYLRKRASAKGGSRS
ncbi:branched-chain amino acid ABC transporter permease [Puniceibacterium sp. HSS470]|jgi:branched-chain amino acid transport system permease protein|nr:branched-chain amino acid ABC transporter permease [Puniceibacterium sp. HSS470]|tara:strand:+ start:37947 stop:38942 length:996 start_codon:yes stop_codon:yes gene_type:complete